MIYRCNGRPTVKHIRTTNDQINILNTFLWHVSKTEKVSQHCVPMSNYMVNLNEVEITMSHKNFATII